MVVYDDGAVVFVRDRLEVYVKPMTDDELNRQLESVSQGGLNSANPYTYANWIDPETGRTPQRFTVFLVRIKNYSFPKVRLDPADIRIETDVGRVYEPIPLESLEDYYLGYATGFAGNSHRLFDRRTDVLRRTMLHPELVFSGQEQKGFVVFPVLHPQVRDVRVHLNEIVLRFDYRNDPIETAQADYVFERDVEKVYSSGSLDEPPGSG